MTLQEINNKFKYILDKDLTGFNEVWLGLQEIDGKLMGDCEDYAITLKREVAGFHNWKYCHCKLNGEGHCILVSPSGNTVIDNNIKNDVSMETYLDIYDITNLRPYKWYELLWKFGTAKIILVYLKLKGRV